MFYCFSPSALWDRLQPTSTLNRMSRYKKKWMDNVFETRNTLKSVLNTINLHYNCCNRAATIQSVKGLQIYLPVSVNRGEGSRRMKSLRSRDQTFTCTSSLLGSLDKQWRTQSDLTVKQTDMDHLKLQGALPAYSVAPPPPPQLHLIPSYAFRVISFLSSSNFFLLK